MPRMTKQNELPTPPNETFCHKCTGPSSLNGLRFVCNCQCTLEEHSDEYPVYAAAPELLDAVSALLSLHGKPHREEWMNDQAFKFAQEVHAKASAALAKAVG